MLVKNTLLICTALLVWYSVPTSYAGDVVITSFSASPSTITAGENTTISWTTEDATSCIPSGGTGGWSQQSIGLPSGSTAIVIATVGTYNFTFTCQGSSGSSAESTVTVSVLDSPGDIISCDSFESCPTLPTGEIDALEARIEALEALLAGATRGLDSSTSQDTLTFDNSTSSETVVVRDLSTTQEEGNLPVCYNGAGELLPCADGVEPPPTDDPYIGSWSGRMIYDRNSPSGVSCFDANVFMVIGSATSSRASIKTITVIRDSGGLDTYSPNDSLYFETGTATGDLMLFYSEIGTLITYSLHFNTQGAAQGYWNYVNGMCYGQWSFTKD